VRAIPGVLKKSAAAGPAPAMGIVLIAQLALRVALTLHPELE
jgi:hypothetical protein